MHEITRGWAAGIAGALLVTSLAACGATDDTADAPKSDVPTTTVSFASPPDGAEIAGSVAVEMVADGVTIEPAGEVHDGAGHFHVLADDGCNAAGEAIAKDADHVHFGKGQTEGRIYLSPGTHHLCLQVGDGIHHTLDLTDTVTVDVGVRSEGDWCGVITEVDSLFDAADEAGDDFAAGQVMYEGTQRLVDQLKDGIDQTPEAVHADITESLRFLDAITTAYVKAATIEDAEAALGPIFAGANVGQHPAGDRWILDTCSVDIND